MEPLWTSVLPPSRWRCWMMNDYSRAPIIISVPALNGGFSSMSLRTPPPPPPPLIVLPSERIDFTSITSVHSAAPRWSRRAAPLFIARPLSARWRTACPARAHLIQPSPPKNYHKRQIREATEKNTAARPPFLLKKRNKSIPPNSNLARGQLAWQIAA